MASTKASDVDLNDELVFSLAEALARQLPRRKRARFVRDWLGITGALEGGATPFRDGATSAARRAAAVKVRDRATELVTKLLA